MLFPFPALPEWLRETAWDGTWKWPLSVTPGLTFFVDVGNASLMVFYPSTFSCQKMLPGVLDYASGSRKILFLRNQVPAAGGRDGYREGSPLGFRWLRKLLPVFISRWCLVETVYRETEIKVCEMPLRHRMMQRALRLRLSPEAWRSILAAGSQATTLHRLCRITATVIISCVNTVRSY